MKIKNNGYNIISSYKNKSKNDICINKRKFNKKYKNSIKKYKNSIKKYKNLI